MLDAQNWPESQKEQECEQTDTPAKRTLRLVVDEQA